MNEQTSNQGTERRLGSHNQTSLEHKRQKRREETLEWLSENALQTLRQAWRNQKHH
jgi:hypothetical protein